MKELSFFVSISEANRFRFFALHRAVPTQLDFYQPGDPFQMNDGRIKPLYPDSDTRYHPDNPHRFSDQECIDSQT